MNPDHGGLSSAPVGIPKRRRLAGPQAADRRTLLQVRSMFKSIVKFRLLFDISRIQKNSLVDKNVTTVQKVKRDRLTAYEPNF